MTNFSLPIYTTQKNQFLIICDRKCLFIVTLHVYNGPTILIIDSFLPFSSAGEDMVSKPADEMEKK